jgi:hypothetical protein
LNFFVILETFHNEKLNEKQTLRDPSEFEKRERQPDSLCLLMEVYTITYEVFVLAKKLNLSLLRSLDFTTKLQEMWVIEKYVKCHEEVQSVGVKGEKL